MKLFGEAFRGKQVLVVGGSSGIGLAIASAFAEHGAKVRITGLSDAEIRAPELSAFECSVLDVTDPAAAARCVEALDGLDALVNCAGMIRRGEEQDPAVLLPAFSSTGQYNYQTLWEL